MAAEQTLKTLCEAHGVEYVVAVPHNIYGPRQKYDDPFRNVASIMINRIMRGLAPIVYGDGEQIRCFSYISDCVEPLALMATADVSGEVINIGPDSGEVSINELVSLLKYLLCADVNPEYMPDRPCEVKHATCSSDKARELLGFEASVPLKDGMKKLIEDIAMRRPKAFSYHIPLEIVNERTPKTWLNQTM